MAEADVTVITVSMPGREHLLAEATESVRNQVLPPAAHLVRVEPPVGEPNPVQLGIERNHLLSDVATTWVACLDDDDLYYQHHLALLMPNATDDVDVLYSYGVGACQLNCNTWDQPEILRHLMGSNFLPYCAWMRMSLLEEAGGYCTGYYDVPKRRFTETGACAEDWDLWIRLSRLGARFRCVPFATWEYRQGPQSVTYSWMGK